MFRLAIVNPACRLEPFRLSRRLLFWLLLLVFSSNVFGAAFNNTVPQYSSRLWQTDNGLPHNNVLAVAQTRDGYLWLGTQSGLARFDGVRFSVFHPGNTPEMKSGFTQALLETQDGSLWIGTGDAGLLRFHNGRFSCFTEADGLAGNEVRALFQSRDASLWIGTKTGLTRFKDGKFSNLTVENGLADDVVRSLCEDKEGNLWIGTPAGLNLWNGEVTGHYTMADGLPSSVVRALCLDRRGALWIGSGGVSSMSSGRITLLDEDLFDNNVITLYSDSRDNLWIGTYGGLNRKAGETLVGELNSEGVAYDQVNAIFEDREGNIWTGTKEGLYRLTSRPCSTITSQQGLSHNNIMSVLEDNAGALWIATWGGGLNRMKDKKITAFSTSSSFSNPLILSLCQDHEGSLWIGLDYNGGLYRLKNRQLAHFAAPQGLIDSAVRVIYEDRQKNLWIGASGSLYLWKDENFVRFTGENGLTGGTIRVILEDRHGTLWIGTNDGLNRHREGNFSTFTAEDGLSHKTVTALYEDDKGDLWIGSAGGGLCKMNSTVSGQNQEEGKKKNRRSDVVQRFTTQNGLFNDHIFEILEDDSGYLWMSCPKGLFRIRKQDLNSFFRGEVASVSSESFGKAEGMVSIQCNGVAKPAAWKSRDGRLWFATTKGLTVVNPEGDFMASPIFPPVVIEEILADKKNVTKDEGQVTGNATNHVTLQLSSVTIPPGRGDLEIHYTALTFRAPEKVRFRYKLDGIDDDWVEVGERRVAYYNNIRPGKYRFQVMGSSNDGVWNQGETALAVVLQPHFWQTKWFFALAGLALVGTVGNIARYATLQRVRRKMERLEQQHAIEKERARIARDMHDNLGIRTTEILLLSDLAIEKRNSESDIRGHVREIAGAAREIVNTLDAIVWAVNPKHDYLDNFALYLHEHAEMFLELSSIRCRMEGQLPHWPLSGEVRHNLFLVAKEAINNIAKHSAASEVWIRLEARDSELRLSIEDDGKGFATESASRTGNGLQNMEERVRKIGGFFKISSQPGKGSRVELRVPLSSGGNS
jgi:ligand-binding sensor domain-containing protein/signal transduction histidine kinase